MIEFLKLLFDRDFFRRKIPLWHLVILLCIAFAGWKLDLVSTGVATANTMLADHGRHLDRIDDALYYGLNIDTTENHPATKPRMKTGAFNVNTNVNLVKIP
jgi:hypothetical protein